MDERNVRYFNRGTIRVNAICLALPVPHHRDDPPCGFNQH